MKFAGPVVGLVVEGFCDAELFLEEVDFLLGAGGCVDGRGTGGFGELDAGDGDGGGAGVPEDGLARLEFADEEEGLGGGYPGLGGVGNIRIERSISGRDL